jgi:phosphopantothenoylcysteine decarboxylase/phosphopantothenate--cysteine ligase
MLKGKKILVGISGGIAAYKMCSLVRLFVKAGAEVRVIMTPSAAKFVSPLTLSVLSRNEVVINMFPPEEDYERTEKVDLKTWHVNLGLWADVFLIAPATANTIAKIVHGISDNFLLTTLLSARCPVLIAPAMDDDMYKNSITQDNLARLIEYGYKVLEPAVGELASGLYGIGRLPEPEQIFDYVAEFIAERKDLRGKKILITAGPTVEELDSVRFITNHSTGKMGFELARAASDRGAEVTLITGPVNLETPSYVKRIDVRTSDEMYKAVHENKHGANLIVMTAAVEDFKPVNTANGKIKKEDMQNKFSMEFEKSVDILKSLGESKNGYKLIGFALETDNELQNAREKLVNKNLDLVVLNNPKEEGAGFGTDTNVVTLIDNTRIEKLPIMSKYEVGNAILDKYLSM